MTRAIGDRKSGPKTCVTLKLGELIHGHIGGLRVFGDTTSSASHPIGILSDTQASREERTHDDGNDGESLMFPLFQQTYPVHQQSTTKPTSGFLGRSSEKLHSDT
jgi:hypothetical protein